MDLAVRGPGVCGGDGGLGVVFRDGLAGDGEIEVMEAESDQAIVPEAAILIFQKNEVAELVDACRRARALECHQRDQSMDTRLRERGPGDQLSQAHRLAAEVVP